MKILVLFFSVFLSTTAFANSTSKDSSEKCAEINKLIDVGYPICGEGNEYDNLAMTYFMYSYKKILQECFEGKEKQIFLYSVMSTSSVQEVKCDMFDACGFSKYKSVNLHRVCGVLRTNPVSF